MKYRLLTIGKTPQWIEDGVEEYSRRVPHLELERVSSSPTKNRVSRMFNQCGTTAAKVVLDKSGRTFSSEGLAKQCQKWQHSGRDVCFLIGDDVGFNAVDLAKADLVWSLSRLTFPHQLTRVIVCEQLYRAHSINSGHSYHRP